MFAKLRRRRPAAFLSARSATPIEASRPEIVVADSDTIARSERIRSAFQTAGVDLDALGPEPTWFTEIRAGRPQTLGATECAELIKYLGMKAAACVTSDEECAKALGQVDMLTVLAEMHAEGITIAGRGHYQTADALRTLRDLVREAERNRSAKQPTTVNPS